MINFTRLKDIREDFDINQTQMANILGVKRSTYSLWELGINIIPLNNLCDYADYFNLPIDYILSLNNHRNHKNNIKGFNLQTLGKNIKEIRLNNNLTQEKLANILGVSQACIVRYEKGQICISISTLYKLSKKFKVPLNDLCGKTNQKNIKTILNI